MLFQMHGYWSSFGIDTFGVIEMNLSALGVLVHISLGDPYQWLLCVHHLSRSLNNRFLLHYRKVVAFAIKLILLSQLQFSPSAGQVVFQTQKNWTLQSLLCFDLKMAAGKQPHGFDL